jgi:hypothetical protein
MRERRPPEANKGGEIASPVWSLLRVTDVFQEVDQSLREETLASFWKRWQWVIYGIVAAVIIAVVAFEVMRGLRNAEIANAAKIYDTAFVAGESGDLATSRTRFTELENDKTGFAVIAGHMLAGVEKQLTDDPAAIEAHLQKVTADPGVLGDFAILKIGYLKADTATLAELEATMKPLIDRNNPVSHLATELVAAKVLAEGDVERARDLFESLAAKLDAPQAMQRRVAQALSTLPPREVNLDAPVTVPTPAPAPAEPAPADAAPAQPAQAQ